LLTIPFKFEHDRLPLACIKQSLLPSPTILLGYPISVLLLEKYNSFHVLGRGVNAQIYSAKTNLIDAFVIATRIA